MKHCARAILNLLLTVFAAAGLWACAATNPSIQDRTLPVNYLEASDRLVTSGQPSATQIAKMDPLQYRMVINLAAPDSDLASPNEADLLGRKGITYVAIPIEMQRPKYRDFALFSSILNATESGRIWVHCRANYRASTFTFLYRVIHEGADPDTAYEKVTEVWVPETHWLNFARETLAKHNIAYEF